MFTIEAAIKNGLEHIAEGQQETGGFASLSSLEQDNFANAVSYSTTFFTSTILACLNAASKANEHSSPIDIIRSRAAAFLMKEKNKDWSFNYWARGATERRTMPYPNDLDDTFGALVALAEYDPTIVNGDILAAVAIMLTGSEMKVGGPYRTWLIKTPNENWTDVDCVVNSTVGYFLSLVDVRIANIEKFLNDVVTAKAVRSPYYPGAAPALYFLSRYYKKYEDANAARKMLNIIHDFRENNATKMTALEEAATIAAIYNINPTRVMDRTIIKRLLGRIEQEEWRPYAFCIDPARDEKISYGGTSALTAALSVEALALHKNAIARKGEEIRTKTESIKRDDIHKSIIALARKNISQENIDPALRDVVLRKIDAVTDAKITTLASDFAAVLARNGKIVGAEMTANVAIGNVYGWIAYTIYDDILDNEDGPLLLPAANLFMRALQRIYIKEDTTAPGCSNLFWNIMNIIDGANHWEQNHCKLPSDRKDRLPGQIPNFGDYNNLSDRSIGHAMGPLAELIAIGYDPESQEFGKTLSLFQHYLIARQLHDDAHDWANDLLRGNVNSVGAIVIKDFQEAREDQKYAGIAESLPEMREIFWRKTIARVVALICQNITAARAARDASKLIGGAGFMERELAALEASAKRTLAERDDTLLFLDRYHLPNSHTLS